MRTLAVVKYPPIEGGVSGQSYWTCHELARAGHTVDVVTNAAEVEPEYRMRMDVDDFARLQADFPGGGAVRVHWTRPWDEDRWHHIPAGNPTMSKLISLSLDVVRSSRPDVIWAYYLEPYGVAASVVSAWTGVPCLVRHAGSDRYALMRNSDLGAVYRQALLEAETVYGGAESGSGFGVLPSRRLASAPRTFVPTEFEADGPTADLNAVTAELVVQGWRGLLATRPLDTAAPVVGMFGKVGPSKGTFDLLRACAEREELASVQVLLLAGGLFSPMVTEVVAELGLKERVWRFPFVPHWRVPEYLRACDVVCALEHDFVIPQHGPGLVREVLAAARPLVVSHELLAKSLELAPDLPRSCHACDPSRGEDLEHAVLAALDDGGPAPEVVRDVRRRLASDRVEVIDTFASALDETVTRRTPPQNATAAEDREQAQAANVWIRTLAPTLWKLMQDEAAPGDSRDHADSFEDVVGRAVGLASTRRQAHPHSTEWAVADFESALLWMHTDLETRRGLPAFKWPERSIPYDCFVDVPELAAEDVYPVSTCWRRWVEPTEGVVEHVRELLAARGLNPAQRALDSLPLETRRPSVARSWLFVKWPSLEGTIFAAGPQLRRLVEAADGSRSRHALEREIFPTTTPPGVRATTWDRLERSKVISFVWYPHLTSGRS